MWSSLTLNKVKDDCCSQYCTQAALAQLNTAGTAELEKVGIALLISDCCVGNTIKWIYSDQAIKHQSLWIMPCKRNVLKHMRLKLAVMKTLYLLLSFRSLIFVVVLKQSWDSKFKPEFQSRPLCRDGVWELCSGARAGGRRDSEEQEEEQKPQPRAPAWPPSGDRGWEESAGAEGGRL